MLQRGRVETRKGNRRGKAVIELMVASEEPGVVKQAVDVVCQDFACQVAVYEMSYCFIKRRQSRRYDEDWAIIGKIAKSNLKSDIAKCHKKSVANAVKDLGTSRLPAGIGLMFMGSRELR